MRKAGGEAKALQRRRLRAAPLLQRGIAQAGVPQRVSVMRTTASRWNAQLQVGGLEALKSRPRGRPRGLEDVQRRELMRALTDGALAEGFAADLWTLLRAGKLIERQFGRAYSESGISKSQVSRLCTEIDERVQAFLNRPIEGDWPYLWIDATYVKVREVGRTVSVAAIIAVAVSTEGVREVLGMVVGPSEAEPFWTQFLRSLTRRGLRGVKLVISDAHEGLKAEAAKLIKSAWQRCRVHFLRNALAHAGKGQRHMVLAMINTAFAQDTQEAAITQWRTDADQLRTRFPKLAAVMDESESNVLAFMSFPKAHRTRIR